MLHNVVASLVGGIKVSLMDGENIRAKGVVRRPVPSRVLPMLFIQAARG